MNPWDLIGKQVWLKQDIITFSGNHFFRGEPVTVLDWQEGEYEIVDKMGKRAFIHDEHFDTWPVKC